MAFAVARGASGDRKPWAFFQQGFGENTWEAQVQDMRHALVGMPMQNRLGFSQPVEEILAQTIRDLQNEPCAITTDRCADLTDGLLESSCGRLVLAIEALQRTVVVDSGRSEDLSRLRQRCSSCE